MSQNRTGTAATQCVMLALMMRYGMSIRGFDELVRAASSGRRSTKRRTKYDDSYLCARKSSHSCVVWAATTIVPKGQRRQKHQYRRGTTAGPSHKQKPIGSVCDLLLERSRGELILNQLTSVHCSVLILMRFVSGATVTFSLV